MERELKTKLVFWLERKPVRYLHISIFFLNDTLVPSLYLTAQLSKFSEEFEQGSGWIHKEYLP